MKASKITNVENPSEIQLFSLKRIDLPRSVSINSIENQWVLREHNDKPVKVLAGPEGGTHWFDFLRARLVTYPMFVSEHVRSEIEAAGFTGIVFRTLKIQCKGRVTKPPCRYFAMLPDGPAPAYKFRFFRVDSEWTRIIEELGEDANSDKTKFGEDVTSIMVPVTSTCSVKDLMGELNSSDTLWGMNANMTCSRRLVEFLYNHKFRGISASILQFFRRETKELAEMPWPPESWCRGYEKEILETGGLRLL